eukprot:TRINITY_DN11407_c0_g1_i1.p1 TRINITY_DN11407_c0_g1~~TRINITY_DN11407_c0_g1_i1.p1  ORF type:complete len:228 (-),score=52.07 TRINITY_DN11407_c0_g1_i1:222-854(-)
MGDAPFDVSKNPNRGVHFARGATILQRVPLSEEEFAAEYSPEVPVGDLLRHAEAVNRVLRSRNVRTEGPGPEQPADEWFDCLAQAEAQVSSSERPTAPTGPSPPAILPDTVPCPGGLWAQLLPVARVQVTLPARYEESPFGESADSPFFVNPRHNPAWPAGGEGDEEAPEDDGASDGDNASVGEAPGAEYGVAPDPLGPGSWSSDEPFGL